jgi:hypothetical protein
VRLLHTASLYTQWSCVAAAGGIPQHGRVDTPSQRASVTQHHPEGNPGEVYRRARVPVPPVPPAAPQWKPRH